MSDKVNYKKNILNFGEIMTKLHNVAVSNAQRIASDILVDNGCFDDEKRVFQKAGEYAITFKYADNREIADSDKKTFFNFAKEYVKYFVGEDASKQIKATDLQPMTDLKNKEGGTPPELSAGTPSGTTTTSESLYINHNDKLISKTLDFLFEATPAPATSVSTSLSGGGTDDEDKQEERIIVGFQMYYAFDIFGQQRKSLGEILKRKTKGFFGGAMADLRNIKINTLGGGQIGIGKMFDPAKWKEAVGVVDINIATAPRNIEDIIKNDYPQSSAQVKVYDAKSLINLLNRQRKWTPEIADKIKKATYSVLILVEKGRDAASDEFTKEKVADICTRAFGTATNITNFNKVKADDVIQIDNWDSEFKVQSIYDRPNSFNKDSNTSGSSKTTKESREFIVLRNDTTTKILNILFENDIIEEAGQHTAAHINELIDKYGTKNILLKKELINHLVSKYGNEDVRPELKTLFKEFFTKGDVNSMKGFVIDKFKKYPKGNRVTQGFWKCLKDAGISDAEAEPEEAPSTKNMPNTIEIGFFKKNPSDDSSTPEKIKTLSGEPGKFNTTDYPTSADTKFDGYDFTGWIPDPNTLSDNGDVNAQYEKVKDTAISIGFMDKDPSKDDADYTLLSTWVGEPKTITKDDYPTVKHDGYELSTWNPDPASLNSTGQVSAIYTKVDISGSNMISVSFSLKDPTKDNALDHIIKTVEAKPGGFDDSNIPEVPEYDGFKFKQWNPDPNEFEKNKQDDKGNVSPNVSKAEFEGEIGDGKNKKSTWTAFIIPHKRLTSQNRPNKEEKFDDGTVRASTSTDEYKPSDMRM